MIILSQDKNIVVNFKNVNYLSTQNIRCFNEKVDIVAYFKCTAGKESFVVLGRYSKENAGKIIEDICDRYQYLCQIQIQNNGISELEFLFKMPKETETEEEYDGEDAKDFEEFVEFLSELADKHLL